MEILCVSGLAYKTISVCLRGANCAVIPSFCGVRLYFNDPYFILAPCAVFPAGANEKSRNCFSLSLSPFRVDIASAKKSLSAL